MLHLPRNTTSWYLRVTQFSPNEGGATAILIFDEVRISDILIPYRIIDGSGRNALDIGLLGDRH
jgi:hypothetical protein